MNEKSGVSQGVSQQIQELNNLREDFVNCKESILKGLSRLTELRTEMLSRQDQLDETIDNYRKNFRVVTEDETIIPDVVWGMSTPVKAAPTKGEDPRTNRG